MPKIPFPTPEQLDAMAEEGRRMIDARRAKGPDARAVQFLPPPRQGLPRVRLRMIFTTYWFIAFSVIVVTVYRLIPRPAWRLGFLGLCCLVFHAHFAGPAGMAPIIVLMIVTYFAALSRRRGACLAAMALTLFALCFYKYVYFILAEAVGPWAPHLAAVLADRAFTLLPGAPPLGISFFAFEFLHYLYEVKNGGEPIRNPLKFLLFSIFFPRLVAGPIKRYRQFIPALEESSRVYDPSFLGEGLFRIATGFVKKVVIADNLNLWIDATQPEFASLSIAYRWVFLGAVGARILMGAFSGAVIGTPFGHPWTALGAGIVGAVLGTLGGYQARKRLVAATGGKDLPIALLEDAVAILGGLAIAWSAYHW